VRPQPEANDVAKPMRRVGEYLQDISPNVEQIS
jgi:hypothetical protein